MILTGKKRSSRIKDLSHFYSVQHKTHMEWTKGLRGDRPATNRLGHDAASLKCKCKYFYSQCSQFPKQHCFLEGTQASPVCPSGRSNMYVKMSKEHW